MNHIAASALSLALVVGLNATSAVAQGATQDRYGPPQPRTSAPTAAPGQGPAAAYAGPMLGWAGKRAPQAPTAPESAMAPERPEPMALSRQYAYAQPPAAPAPRAPPPAPVAERPQVQPGYEPVLRGTLPPVSAAPVSAAPVSDRAPDLLGGPPAGPLPTSIYGQGVAAPAPARTEYRAAAPADAPQQLAQSAPLPAARRGGTQLYSLHREYGMTPDAIPAPPQGQNYILVGPPDAPPAEDNPDAPDRDAEGLDRQF